jgi:hypothetical protein
MKTKLQFTILPSTQKDILEVLAETQWISSFFMVGGTALALQIGHRRSVDFDFFSKDYIKNREITSRLSALGTFELFSEAENTVNGSLNGVRVSFFKYDYSLLEDFIIYKNVKIAGKLDIALMKLEAISGRGSKKDFVDLYFLLDRYELSELFLVYKKKFGEAISNNYHLLKSLVYFEDAEREAMPVMRQKISWMQVKEKIKREVKSIEIY